MIVIGLMVTFVLLRRLWEKRRASVTPSGVPALRVPRINDDLCIGCEKCVAICPTNVLELLQHKSQVKREGDCISCQKCAEVCPTQALVMYEGGVRPTKEVVLPNLDEHYQSRQVPGLYLIGEAAGKPLVKNGVNLGRAAVEHIRLRSGLTPLTRRPIPPRPELTDLDVVVIGAGPAGLSAGMTCLLHGLSYVVLERTDSAMSTVMRYPITKSVHAEPRNVRCLGFLPVWDCGTLDLRAEWNRIIEGVQLNVMLETSGEDVQRDETTGAFLVTTRNMRSNSAGTTYRAQRVVVAIGGLGIPKKLGGNHELPGENLPHVRKMLDDASQHVRKTLLVVGGGDSAVESAVDLARAQFENRVLLSYHKKEGNLSCNRKNLALLKQTVAEERILPLFESSVVSFTADKVRLRLTQPERRERDIPVDNVFVMIGGEPPKSWLEKIKINYLPIQHALFRRPPTDQLVESLVGRVPENNRPGQPLPTPVSTTVLVPTLLQPPAVTAVESQAPRGARPARRETIKIARADQRFRLPERAQVEGSSMTHQFLKSKKMH